MRYLRIEVTPEHIADGIPEHGMSCPIALALEAAGAHDLIVDYDGGSDDMDAGGRLLDAGEDAGDPDTAAVAALPRKAARFMHAFDGNHPVKPFAFTVRLPDRFVR